MPSLSELKKFKHPGIIPPPGALNKSKLIDSKPITKPVTKPLLNRNVNHVKQNVNQVKQNVNQVKQNLNQKKNIINKRKPSLMKIKF